jgi:hypothetical protein
MADKKYLWRGFWVQSMSTTVVFFRNVEKRESELPKLWFMMPDGREFLDSNI